MITITREIQRINIKRANQRYHRYKNPDKYKEYRKKNKYAVKVNTEKKKINLRRYRYNRTLKTCEQCNKEFVDMRNNNKKFCTKKCSYVYFKEKYKQNGKWKFYKKTRRAKENNIIHNFNQEDWENKIKMYGGFCPYCNKKAKLTMDHIMPISKVPNNYVYNINDVQGLCIQCNRRKNNKMIRLSIGKLGSGKC